MLRSVAVMYHALRPQAVEAAGWLRDQLSGRGVDVLAMDGWDHQALASICCDKDLIIALGGDGTIIHVARLAAPIGVPVVGVNMGRVGFLAELSPEDLRNQIEALVDQRYWIEQHTMIDVTFKSRSAEEHFLGLNEVVVARGGLSHAVHVRTFLDGDIFLTHTADGVLVATATGSTAYSLAAGGPIMYPESRDLLITPIAPHLHIGRSMVVRGETVVRLELASDRPGTMSVDGVDERQMTEHDSVEVRRSETIACFARLNPAGYFFAAIGSRLQ